MVAGIPTDGRWHDEKPQTLPDYFTWAGYSLEGDERSPLRSDVYRIVVLAHALSGPTSIPTRTGARWLTGDRVTHAARLRQVPDERGIPAYLPIHPWQESTVVRRRGFQLCRDYLKCSQGGL